MKKDDEIKALPEGSFQSESELESFCKWILRTPIPDDKESEFKTDEEFEEFIKKRNRRLQIQIDDISEITLKSANVHAISGKYFKIVKTKYKNPLSSEGSNHANTRFNYKDIDELRNRTIYFGQDKTCCYAEIFHLEIHLQNYKKILLENDSDLTEEELDASEFLDYKYNVHEFEIEIPNILILTTESTYKALGIPNRVVKDEWYSVNDDFEIPTAGQLLGTIARRNGFNGILFTSIRNQTKSNLVLFEENTGELKFKEKGKYELNHDQLNSEHTK